MKFKLQGGNKKISETDLIADLLAVSKKLERDMLSVSDYIIHGKYGYCDLRKNLGGWHIALEKAGLKYCDFPKKMITEGALFKNLAEVWMKLGKQPGMREMKHPLSAYSYVLYIRFFGSWMNALRNFVEYGNASSPPSPLSDPCADAIGDGEPEGFMGQEPVKKDKRGIPHKMRFGVLLRDGFRCTACGKSPLMQPGVELHCDHIIPWSKGGKTVMDNLKTLCSVCNIGKGDEIQNTMERPPERNGQADLL